MKTCWLVVLALMGVGCASGRVVRLETGGGAVLEHVPPAPAKSVRVGEKDFEKALTRLVLDAPLSVRLPEAGRWVKATSYGRLADALWQRTLGRDYGRWCQAREQVGDCLSLLEDGLGFSAKDRLAVALGLAMDPMHESIAEALQESVSPRVLEVLVVTSLVTWVAMAAAPEPVFTKGMAVLSVVLMAYWGFEQFVEVVRASLELKEAAEAATTFQALEEAGARFGRVMGVEGARLFVLAVTALAGQGVARGAGWAASRLAMLPRFTEAVVLGSEQWGLRLVAVEQVSTVAVVGGEVRISLAPTAVAMAAMPPRGTEMGKAPPPGGPGEWVKVKESMSERARDYQEQVTGAPRDTAYRVRANGEEADFDGFKDGVLLEAKGPGYAKFIHDAAENGGWFRGFRKMLEQAQNQRAVASETPIQWYFAEREAADFVRNLFRRSGLDEISVLFKSAREINP